MPIINNKKVDELNFEYGVYVDYNEPTPTLKYGTKPGVIVVRKGNLDTKVGCDSFDNSLGGIWNYYISIPIITSPSEDVQYKVEITDTSVNVYFNDGTKVIATGTCGNFWDETNQVDIRVFDENLNQNYFWIEEFDMTNKKAVIWIKLHSGQKEIGIAYGNKDCSVSDYCNGDNVFEFFDDFDKTKLNTMKWTIDAGGSNYNYVIEDSILKYSPRNNVDMNNNLIMSYTPETAFIVEVRHKHYESTDVYRQPAIALIGSKNKTGSYNHYQYTTYLYYSRYGEGEGLLLCQTGSFGGSSLKKILDYDTVETQWRRETIIYHDNYAIFVSYFEDDKVTKSLDTSGYTVTTPVMVAWSANAYTTTYNWIDYIFIRKYISTDLSFGTPIIKEF